MKFVPPPLPPREKGDTCDTILAIFIHAFAYLALSAIPEEIESLTVVYFQATLEHNFHITIGIQKPTVRDRSFITYKLGGDGLKKSKSQDTVLFTFFKFSWPCTISFQDIEILKFFHAALSRLNHKI